MQVSTKDMLGPKNDPQHVVECNCTLYLNKIRRKRIAKQMLSIVAIAGFVCIICYMCNYYAMHDLTRKSIGLLLNNPPTNTHTFITNLIAVE